MEVEPPGAGPEGAAELSRDLGFFAVFSTATGTIGASIFVLPGIAAAGAGSGAAISFLLAGFITFLTALSVCELATAMPEAGGPYYYVSRGMGAALGTVVGLGAWSALVLKGAFALAGLGQYVYHFSPVPVVATAMVGGALLVGINLVGTKLSGIVQSVIVVALLAILGGFIGIGLFAVEDGTLAAVTSSGWGGVLSTTGTVFVAYLGTVKAASVAGEVRNPGRNLPLGLLSSVVLVTALFVLTMVVVTGVLPIAVLESSTAPLSDAGAAFLGSLGGAIVGASGILATLSTGNSVILSSSRYPYAMSRDGLMTPWISEISARFRTPVRAIALTGGVMLVLVALLDVSSLAKLAGIYGVIVFALVNLSVVILRWTSPEWYRPSFRVPLYPVLPLFAAMAALATIPQSGLLSQAAALGLIVVGAGWYRLRVRQTRRTGEVIQPEYGLADKIQEIRQVQALEEKRRVAVAEPTPEVAKVVVELVAGKPNKHLLALASAVARRAGAQVEVVVITEVPPQSPFEGAVARLPRHWVESLRTRLEEHGVPFRFHRVLARDRAHAILSFAQPGTRSILLDWHDEPGPFLIRGSYLDRVLSESPVRVGVLKYRGNEAYDRVLVATAGSPYAPAEVELADALAAMTGAALTLLMVLPASASPGREEQARKYLEQLTALTETDPEIVVQRGDDVAETILAAGRDADLIVLGAARPTRLERLLSGHALGRFAGEIAERAEGSVLVSKEPRTQHVLSSRLGRWLRRVLRAMGGGPDLPEHPAGEPVPDVKIRPFPRGRRP